MIITTDQLALDLALAGIAGLGIGVGVVLADWVLKRHGRDRDAGGRHSR